MGHFGVLGRTSKIGHFGPKRVILAQKGPFWLKKDHFDPLLGSWGGPPKWAILVQKGPFWAKKAQKGPFWPKKAKKGLKEDP